jgi:MOSC domain-containing protein YiiM
LIFAGKERKVCFAKSIYMSGQSSSTNVGRVASIHLHPIVAGEPLTPVDSIQAIELKGIEGEPRYFGRLSQSTGQPNKRQLSLMEREQIAEHAKALGLAEIAPGAVRSNIETEGIDLQQLVGSHVAVGEAVLSVDAARDPCAKMDAICKGLRELMMNKRQGVMARIIKSGVIRVGDPIRPI